MSEISDHIPDPRPLRLRMPFGRRGWLLAAFALITAGAALNWGWLTAIGAAPLILSLAPCAAMCAAGICMTGGSKSCATTTVPAGARNPADNSSTMIGRNDT